MAHHKLQYGRAATLNVPLYADTGIRVTSGSIAAGDATISKDDAAFGAIGTDPTIVGGMSVVTLSLSELTCRKGAVKHADQGATAFADDITTFETIDHPLANQPNGVSAYGIAAGGSSTSLIMNSEPPNVSTFDDLFKGHLLRIKHGGLLAIGTITISATAEKFKTTTTLSFLKAGLRGTKAATDNLVFSAADTINVGAAAGQFWGGWLVTYDGTSAFATQRPSADQVYASEAAALAAARALTPAAGTVKVGYITVQSKTNIAWTANTDDMTVASDCAARTFTDASLIGGAEESVDVISYTASSRTLGFAANLKAPVVQSVDEYWTYVAPQAPTTTELVAAFDAGSGMTALLGADRTYVKAVAVTAFGFPMYDTDGLPATGKTVTVQVSKDGGAFATVAGSVTEISGGWYKVDLSGTEMNADEVAFKATATDCQQTDLKIRTQS